MNNIKYVLRANYFNYQDDLYCWAASDDRSRICGVYDHEDEALAAWQALEHQTILQRPLQQISDFAEMRANKLAELDALVFGFCGHHISEDYECEKILAQLKPEQLFEFLKQARLFSYQLVKMPDDQIFYVGSLPRSDDYLAIYPYQDIDRHLKVVLYYSSGDELLRRYVHEFANAPYGELDDDYGVFQLKGSLDELSHDPEALQQLINKHRGVIYDHKNHLLILDYDVDVLYQVYPLLKQAPLVLQEVTVQQLAEIQRRCDQQAEQRRQQASGLPEW